MASVKDITALCKAGRVQEAYEQAKTDFASNPTNPWVQREVGWALYYLIKGDAETGNYDNMVAHITELKSLDQLNNVNDNMIFDNVQFQIGNFIKVYVTPTDSSAPSRLSTFFSMLKEYNFNPSKGHSYLLSNVIKIEIWPEMADFFDWWNLDSLTPEDYISFVNQNGQKMMTLAERAFIANAKALLRLNDANRITAFLPKLEKLVNEHEEMMYPGYFYGKLLMTQGDNTDEALKVVIPFARKKATEFWVWQLLSDIFVNDPDKQLACLLQAVNCRTQESFLGKVRIKLASLYIQRNMLDCARFHIDAVTRCYASQGWRLPNEIDYWVHQSWLNTASPDGNSPIDYKTITEGILCDGAEECVAVVTYIDQNSHKSSMIYGYEKRMAQKLRFNVQIGNILKIHYITEKEGRIKVLSASKCQLPNNLNYVKRVEGTIDKKEDKEFAFLKTSNIRCFIAPTIVKNENLKNGDKVKCLIVYDYDKKRESWNWVCVNVKK